MAKISLETTTAGYQSATSLRANFTALDVEFQNGPLYRNNPVGEPNEMNNDIDMNSNDILNVANIDMSTATLGGSPITAAGVEIHEDAVVSSDTVASLVADTVLIVGQVVRTVSYRAGYTEGSAIYLLKSVSQAATDGDTVDEIVNHTMVSGLIAVFQAVQDTITIDQAGAYPDNTETVTTTAAIKAACDYASANKFTVIDEGGDYSVSRFRILNGIRELRLTNGTLITTGESALDTNGVVQLDGPLKFSGTAVTLAKIAVRMDMSGGDRVAIFNDGGSSNTFEGSRIFGFTDDVSLNHYGILNWYNSNRNIYKNNRIVGVTAPIQRGLLIDFIGEETQTFAGYFANLGATVRSPQPCKNNIVVGNTLEAGSYGINLVGSEKNILANNQCIGQNHRSIFMGASCLYNTVIGNELLDFLSTAVHLSYGCSYNKIIGNMCFRELGAQAAGTGEAVLQAYVGCKYNEFIDNHCDADTTYGIYTAIDSIGNTIQGNVIRNHYSAAIAVENEWLAVLPTGASYSKPSFDVPPEGVDWSFNDTERNVIEGNKIWEGAAGRNTAAIYVAQIDAPSGTSNTTTHVSENKVMSGDQIGFNLYLYANTDAKLNAIKLAENLFDSGNISECHNPSGLTTWNDKLDFWSGNDQLDEILRGESITFTDLDATPSVTSPSPDTYFTISNSSTTAITDFDDGYVGQEIELRGDGNTTITYSSGLIRTKGNVNVTGMNANTFIKFKLVGSIWYEIWRSF